MSDKPTKITISVSIKAPVEKVWENFTNPEAVMQWNNASDDWHTPKAVNDLRVGGKFIYTMAAKDGSFSFDFGGEYDNVLENQLIEYTIEDGRQVSVRFTGNDEETYIEEIFEAESQNPVEMQEQGWQAILNNFKAFVEKSN